MNNQVITQTQHEKNCHKVLFRVNRHVAMVHSLIQSGMDIKMDATCEYACACFDNTIDYNEFKEKIKHFSSMVSA